MTEHVTRRELLAMVGTIGAAAAFTSISGLPSTAEAVGGTTEKWPWPYVKLNPEKTAEIAYNEWYRVFCGAAVISSVFSQLREKVGEPYKSFPVDAFVFLEGGTVGWGTICGSNAGANIVSNMIIGPRIAGPDCENGELLSDQRCCSGIPELRFPFIILNSRSRIQRSFRRRVSHPFAMFQWANG